MEKYSRMWGAAVIALALAGAAACSSSSNNAASPNTAAPSTAASMSSMPSETGSAPASAADTITIQSFAFSAPITVSPGVSVTVMNKDSVDHTVTADSAGGFDVTVPAQGTATFTAPTAPGSYAFHCSIHPSMQHSMLIVK